MASKDKTKDWDCTTCINDGLSVLRGCHGEPKERFSYVTKYGQRFDHCPKRFARENAYLSYFVQDYLAMAQYNQLPHGGGWLDQNPVFILACNVVSEGLDHVRKTDEALDGAKQGRDQNRHPGKRR